MLVHCTEGGLSWSPSGNTALPMLPTSSRNRFDPHNWFWVLRQRALSAQSARSIFNLHHSSSDDHLDDALPSPG